MANICINRFYCSTDNEANYEKILYGLGDRFDVSYPCVGMYRKVPIRTRELVERRMDVAARQAASS